MSLFRINTTINNSNPMYQLVTSPDSLSTTKRSITSSAPLLAPDSVKNIFLCNQCGKRFTAKSSLKRHQLVHTGVKPHVCPADHCGRKFALLFNLKRHQSIHTGAKPYKCSFDQCDRTFRTRSGLKCHLKKHRTHDVIELGQEPVSWINQIPQHLINQIPENLIDKISSSSSSSFASSPLPPMSLNSGLNPLSSHDETGFDQEPVSWINQIPQHLINQIPENLIDKISSLSSSSFASSPLPSMSLNSDLNPLFVHDEIEFAEEPEFGINQIPPISLKYMCNPLSPHGEMELNQEPESGINQTPESSSSFASSPFPPMPSIPSPTPSSPIIPVAVPSSSEKSFACKKCDKTFKRACNYKRHYQNVHTGKKSEKPFECVFPGCHRRYKWVASLRKHERYHTGKNLHPCNQCKRKFTSAGSLVQHMRIHTGEKPFVCTFPQCNKSFNQSSNLRHHQYRHSVR